MTCAKFNAQVCVREQEHISLIGQFATAQECEDTIKFFTDTFEYSNPTTRARLFCRDMRKKK